MLPRAAVVNHEVAADASSSRALVVGTNHRMANWAQALLEDLGNHNVWRGPTICILSNVTAADEAALRPLCEPTEAAFPLDAAFDPWRTANYSFGASWNRLELLYLARYRRFATLLWIDVDHRLLGPFDMAQFAASTALALPHAFVPSKRLDRYRDLKLDHLDAQARRDLARHAPQRRGEGVYSNKIMVINTTLLAPPHATKHWFLGLLRAYGPEVSRYMEQGFLQLAYWNSTSHLHADGLARLQHLYGHAACKEVVAATGQCPPYRRSPSHQQARSTHGPVVGN